MSPDELAKAFVALCDAFGIDPETIDAPDSLEALGQLAIDFAAGDSEALETDDGEHPADGDMPILMSTGSPELDAECRRAVQLTRAWWRSEQLSKGRKATAQLSTRRAAKLSTDQVKSIAAERGKRLGRPSARRMGTDQADDISDDDKLKSFATGEPDDEGRPEKASKEDVKKLAAQRAARLGRGPGRR